MSAIRDKIQNRITILKMILEHDTYPDKTDEFTDLQEQYNVPMCEDPWYDGWVISAVIQEFENILNESD